MMRCMQILVMIMVSSMAAAAPAPALAPVPPQEPLVPAIFIFGDSTVDVGTNNYLLASQAKADFPYNGIDFDYRNKSSDATGRFSNGFNTADQIVRLMGYEMSPPPYYNLTGNSSDAKKVACGVNFASGGSGIINSTGFELYKYVITLDNQIEQFKELVNQNTVNKDVVPRSLFIISVGSNDILDHYRYNRTTISKSDFMANIQVTFYNQLKSLCDAGAKKFGIISVPPIGCCPYARALNECSKGGCLEELNDYAQTFFQVTEVVLQNLSSQVEGIKYSLGNAFQMTKDFMENPLVFGFTEIKSACCGNGAYNGQGPCYYANNPNLCEDRKNHLFWDWYHPTEEASRLAALTLFGARQKYVTPINFNQLVVVN